MPVFAEIDWLPINVLLFMAVIIVAVVDLTRRRDLDHLLGFVAGQLNGRLVSGGFRHSPRVTWTLEGIPCLLTLRLEGAYVPGNVAVSFQRPTPMRVRL